MVKVKLFGLLRIDSGIKEFDTEADKVKDIYSVLLRKASENGRVITEKNIRSCAVMVNGQHANKNTKLKNGDEVIFMSMVAGG